jgi:hypothetical protein
LQTLMRRRSLLTAIQWEGHAWIKLLASFLAGVNPADSVQSGLWSLR